MKKNDIITLVIDDVNNLGYGVGRHDGAVVFCDGAVTGDEIRAKIIKVATSYAVARAEEYTVRSPLRTESACPYGSCGGCAYNCLDYRYEKEIKRRYVRNAFRKCGIEADVAEVASDGKITGYRNKAQYPVSMENGRYAVGFYSRKSHRVVPCDGCALQPPIFADICRELTDCFGEYGISVYDEKSGRGLLRHIYLRRSETYGEISLVLVVSDGGVPHIKEIADRITGKFPEIVCLMINVNTKNTNVICSDDYRLIFGRGYIRDRLCGTELEISPAAFYQVNHGMTEKLYRKAGELASLTGRETVADLYCGIGSIGLSMAGEIGRLVGIEIVDSAVECARRNASNSGIPNAEFYAGDAGDAEKFFKNAKRQSDGKFMPDVMILDPPRKGCDASLLEYAAKNIKVERIVYISCNPDTLARDAALLLSFGYEMSTVYPFDLFPRTGHVENVTVFRRADKA